MRYVLVGILIAGGLYFLWGLFIVFYMWAAERQYIKEQGRKQNKS